MYTPEQARVAAVVAELLAAAGKRREASDFGRQADFDTTVVAQRRQARTVMKGPTDDWDEWDYIQATALLLRAGKAMLPVCPLRETLAVYEHATELAERAGLRHEQIRALLARGELHLWLGQHKRAESLLEESRVRAQELDWRATVATASHRLGEVELLLGNPAAARRHYEEAIDGFRQVRDRRNEAVVWNDLGMADLQEGDPVGAREKLNKALQVLSGLPRLEQQIGAVWANLAAVDMVDGKWAAAAEKLREAIKLERRIGDRLDESSSWHSLGQVALHMGELDAAEKHLRRALELVRQLGVLSEEGRILQKLAVLGMVRGEFAEARSNLVRALRLAQRFDSRRNEAIVWESLADLAVEQGHASISAPLRATSVLLFRTIPAADSADGAAAGHRKLQELVRRDPTLGDVDAVLAAAERAYGKDRGWGSVQTAFGPLDDLEPAGAISTELPNERHERGPAGTERPPT